MNIKRILLPSFGIMAVLLLIFTYQNKTEDTSTPEIQTKNMNAPDFKQYIEANSPTIIDVRTPEEFSAGNISGSVNIDFYGQDFANQIASLDTSKQYAIYCHSGSRSGATLKIMAGLGFTNVTELTGGMMDWERAGF